MNDDKFVYFAERDGLIKIGCSCNPKRRAQNQQAKLLKTKHGGFADEKTEHARFAEHAVGREWFTSAPELLAYIESLPVLPPPPEPPLRWVGMGVAASMLGVSRQTVSRWCDERKIAYWRSPGRRRYVFVESIEAALTEIEPDNEAAV